MIWIIVILGLILRLISINQSLWLDEGISLVSSKSLSFYQIIYELAPSDVHPPGYYLLLKVWILIFGDSTIAARILSVIFGVLLIYITYLLARKYFGKTTAYLSSLFMAVSPLGVYYSQEIRMYSAAAFFSGASFWFLSLVIDGKKYASFLYIISNLAVLSLDYTAYLIFPAQIIFVFLYNRKIFPKILILLICTFILATPFLILLPEQLSKGRDAAQNLPLWAKVVGGSSLKDFALLFAKNIVGRISFENKMFYGGIVSIFSLLYLYLLYKAWKTKESRMFFLWLLTPIILSFSISFFLPIFAYHRFIFILPALYILFSVGILSLKKFHLTIILSILVVSLASLGIYYLNPIYQRENWKQAFDFVSKKKSNDLILFEDNHIPPPYTYYDNNKTKTLPGLVNIPANSSKDLVGFGNLDKNKNLLIFEYLFQINDPEQFLIKKIESSGFRKINTYNFAGVGFIYEYQFFDRMK